jgi:hypothetical protein
MYNVYGSGSQRALSRGRGLGWRSGYGSLLGLVRLG